MRTAALLVLTLLAGTALATNKPPPDPRAEADARADADATAVAAAISGAHSSAEVDVLVDSSVDSVEAFGGSVEINQPAPDIPDRTPDVGLALQYPTAPCRTPITAGLSLPGAGAGVGIAPMDHECNFRETARFLLNIGQHEAGYRVLCQTEAMGAVYTRPDPSRRRPDRMQPDPEGCLAAMMGVAGTGAVADLQESVRVLIEANDGLRSELVSIRENQEFCENRSERIEDELNRCVRK